MHAIWRDKGMFLYNWTENCGPKNSDKKEAVVNETET